MKIEFKDITAGWGYIYLSHVYYPEIVTYDLEKDTRSFKVSPEGKDFSGKFSVSYIENPIWILQQLKFAAEKGEDKTIIFDAEGRDSTIHMRNIAGDYYEFLWRNERDEFGGITCVKQHEIIAAVDELIDFVRKNKEEIELNWMDKIFE